MGPCTLAGSSRLSCRCRSVPALAASACLPSWSTEIAAAVATAVTALTGEARSQGCLVEEGLGTMVLQKRPCYPAVPDFESGSSRLGLEHAARSLAKSSLMTSMLELKTKLSGNLMARVFVGLELEVSTAAFTQTNCNEEVSRRSRSRLVIALQSGL